MGTKYTNQAQSGYNVAPPPDDGSAIPANLVTWSGLKTKLADPTLTLAQAINTALNSALDFSGRVLSTNGATIPGDHMQTIEVTAVLTASLLDVATGGAGYIVSFINTGVGVVTVAMQNPANTLDGMVNGTTTIPAGGWAAFKVNKAATGYYSYGLSSSGVTAVNFTLPNNTPFRGAEQIGVSQLTTMASAKWNKVAYGNGVYVAIQGGWDAAASTVAASSTDGITWTARTLPTSTTWQDIAFNGTVFCAIAGGGTLGTNCATSADGITWVAHNTLPASDSWFAITANPATGMFVALVLKAASTVAASSLDGVTWTPITLPTAQYWSAITFGNGVFCAVAGQYGIASNIAATSSDGVTWTNRTMATSTWWGSIAYGNGTFVALRGTSAGTNVNTSANGITWAANTGIPSNLWASIAYGNGVFYAIGITSASTPGAVAATSLDGITWTARTMPASDLWNGICYGSSAGFVSVAGGGFSGAATTNGATTKRTFYIDANGNATFFSLPGFAESETTFDLASATGTLTFTTAFKPKCWIIIAGTSGLTGAVPMTIAFGTTNTDATKGLVGLSQSTAGNVDINANAAANFTIQTSASAYQTFTFNAVTATTLVLTNTKTSTPTGTVSLKLLYWA